MKGMIKRIFRKNTIFKQLVIFVTAVGLVPILFVSFFMFQKLNGMVTKDLIGSHYQLVAQYTSNLEDRLSQYNSSLKQIANNTIILNTLMDESPSKNPYIKGNDVSIEVNKSLQLETDIELRNCMVYSDVDESQIYGKRVAMMDGASREIWFLNNMAKDEDYFIYDSVDKKIPILSLIQNILYTDVKNQNRQYIGFIKLDVYMARLFAPTISETIDYYPYDVIVLDDQETIVYASNDSFNSILEEQSFEQLEAEKPSYYKDTLVITDYESNYGLRLIFLFDNSQLSDKRAEMGRTLVPIIFGVILLIVITGYAFTRKFSKRIEKLILKIKVAETGDLSRTDEIEGSDEIAILDKQFNHMLKKLEGLIRKNYVQQLEKKETELRNLQLQINPHFLYNMLETISSIAAVEKVYLICELCEKLGDNFRYSLGKNYGEFVSVKEELKHIKNYVYIQKTRFGNKFEVYYNIEPELEDKMILRFILQPIVENAIVHGLSKNTEKGTLEISISQEDGLLVIKIEDDGVGMTLERVEAITTYINVHTKSPDEKRESIGVRNVHQRIRLACGPEYGITIESTINQGSCFTINLPLMQ